MFEIHISSVSRTVIAYMEWNLIVQCGWYHGYLDRPSYTLLYDWDFFMEGLIEMGNKNCGGIIRYWKLD